MTFHGGLQALRGILALAVFAQHLFWEASTLAPGPVEALYALNLGGLGVLLFFALSGYLMSGKAGDPPGKFLIDRVRRVVPLFWLTIAMVTVTFGLVIGWYPPMRWDIVALLPNGRTNTLHMPHWSLYFEVFFYALVWLVARVRVAWVRPAIVLWGAAGYLFYARPYDYGNYSPPTVFHLVFPVFALFFAAGVMAGWGFRPSRRALAPYALAAVVLCFHQYPLRWLGMPGMASDVSFALIATGAAAAVRAALCWPAEGAAGRVLRWVGDASYGVYLIHMLAMDMAVRFLKIAYVPGGYWAALLLIVALALPPALLWGRFDVWLQRRLKALQHTDTVYWPGWYWRSTWPSSWSR